jgi:hypothetical protein
MKQILKAGARKTVLANRTYERLWKASLQVFIFRVVRSFAAAGSRSRERSVDLKRP